MLLMYAAGGHQARPLVFAVVLSARRSSRSPTPHAALLTHPTAHWPSWWPDPAAPLAARPLPPLLCLFDTIPSSSSCFRTSLLVYHLFSLSPNIWGFPAKLDTLQRIVYCKHDKLDKGNVLI